MGYSVSMREVRWEYMFPDELEAAFLKSPIVYLPYGICEPHGPHCALGLDGLKANGLCCAAARAHGGIVAPPDYWHVHELGAYAVWAAEHIGERRPWLTAVPPWVHFKNVCYHLRAVDAQGFHAAILLTGHAGPNWHDLKRVVKLLQPHFEMRILGVPDFEANIPGFDEGGDSGDHADKVETSQLWALEPNAVDWSRLPPEGAPGPHFAMGKTVRKANRRTGERMVADQVAWLGKAAAELLAQYEELETQDRKPLSFSQIEQIWTEQIEPNLGDFESMKEFFEGQSEPPPIDSRWRLNWHVPNWSSKSQIK
jgi:creatinine amidohydrolase